MRARLPRLPGSEPLDRRVAVAFVVLTLALLSPSLPGVFVPTGRQGLANTRDSLESDVDQILRTIDLRAGTTEPYFRTAVEDVGERAAGIQAELDHRAVAADAADLRDALSKLADALAVAADDLTTAYGDEAAIGRERAAIEGLRAQLETLGPPGS